MRLVAPLRTGCVLVHIGLHGEPQIPDKLVNATAFAAQRPGWLSEQPGNAYEIGFYVVANSENRQLTLSKSRHRRGGEGHCHITTRRIANGQLIRMEMCFFSGSGQVRRARAGSLGTLGITDAFAIRPITGGFIRIARVQIPSNAKRGSGRSRLCSDRGSR